MSPAVSVPACVPPPPQSRLTAPPPQSRLAAPPPQSRLAAPPPQWWIVVPVKDTARGKSRITAAPAVRARLARSLAADTIEAAVAAAGVRAVLAVVDTATDTALATAAGALPVPTDGPGLAAAVEAGLTAAPEGAPVAVLLGDLPAARPSDIADVLAAVRPGEAVFVADAAGTGTTLVAARDRRLRPLFGPGSAQAHRRAGFRDLAATGEIPEGLRHDVDTAADLAVVAALPPPIGRATGALLADDELRAALTAT